MPALEPQSSACSGMGFSLSMTPFNLPDRIPRQFCYILQDSGGLRISRLTRQKKFTQIFMVAECAVLLLARFNNNQAETVPTTSTAGPSPGAAGHLPVTVSQQRTTPSHLHTMTFRRALPVHFAGLP